MSHSILLFLQSFTTLFLVIDPPGLIPLFVSMTYDMDKIAVKKLLIKCTFVAFLLLFVFTLFGRTILFLFSIDIDDFRVAGGIMLLIIALQMIFGSDSQEHKTKSFGVVPIATPLLAGPGAVTAAIVMSGTTGIFITLLSTILVLIVNYYLLVLSKYLLKYTGKEFLEVITKIIGLLLAAISIHYIREGIIGVYESMSRHG